MSSRCSQFGLLASLILATLPAAAEDSGLFSTLALESVFASNSARPAQATEAPSPRVTGAKSLSRLLEKAGYKAERTGETGVRTAVEHDGMTLPLELRVQIDQDEIACTVLLAKLKADEKRTSEQWQQLLAQPDSADVGHFVYDSHQRRIELRSTLSNRGLTKDGLHRHISRLARLADSRYDAWAPAGKSKNSAAALPVGAWVATIGSNEAFAVRFTASGDFQLVHTGGGRSTTSSGKATLSKDQLSLAASDGTKLSGSLSGVSSKGFTLTIGGRALRFEKP